jgi:hypothetical protein
LQQLQLQHLPWSLAFKIEGALSFTMEESEDSESFKEYF